MLNKIKSVMIANRGEISLRIIRACQELVVKSVAIYSEADKNTLPVKLADSTVCIPGSTVENTEYFSLPDYAENRSGSTPSSSEYQSDNNNDINQDSGSFSLPPSSSNSSHGTSPPRKVSYGYYKNPAPLPPSSLQMKNKNERRALVIYDYNRKSSTEMSLEKSQVVDVN